MSALPKAVQKQIAEANLIAEQLKNVAPPSAPAPVDSKPPEGAVTVPPVVVPEVPPVTPPGAPPPEESWEKKYRVLQGKYNAEVPRLQQQVRELIDSNRNMQSQITVTQGLMSTLAQRGTSAPVNPQGGAPAPYGKLVNDAEIKSFGPDLYDFIQRAAREVMAPEVAKIGPATQRVEQVAQSVQTLGDKVAQTDQQRFEVYLDQHAPGWSEQNENPEFIDWLAQADPYTGRTRQELLNQAAERLDGSRVVALFKGFQNENAIVTPPPPVTPAVPAVTPRSLESMVAPGTPKSGAGGAPNEAQKRIYTRSEIDSFQHRKNQYVIKGRKVPDALVAEERAIIDAAREGRVSG